jgi:zeta-carotene desaturase
MDAPLHVIPQTPTFGDLHSSAGAKASVGIIGGGLAGLAAGCALAEAGFAVTLFERKPYLGGRASSYEHPGTGEVVDNCQHVLLGCCTNLLDLYRRLGVQDRIHWYDRLTFIEPGGRRGNLEASALPAPLHALPAFFRFPLLSAIDKLRIAGAMALLVESLHADDTGSFLAWLKRNGQTRRTLERFWSPVLVSALNEESADVSVRYGAMVFRDAFLKSAQAGRLGVPSVPLSQLYGVAGDYIRRRGGQVLLRTAVESLGADDQRAWITLSAPASRRSATSEADSGNSATDGEEAADGKETITYDWREDAPTAPENPAQQFDYLISAVPFHLLRRLMPNQMQSDALRENLSQLRTSPITGIHLWFDRQVTELHHAVLLERTIQWMFQKSKILQPLPDPSRTVDVSAEAAEAPSYLELVVSSSKTLLDKSRQEIIDLALKELTEFFPAVGSARLLKATVIKEVHATFVPAPGSERFRPKQAGPWSRFFLSGDWTATGWPATMEGAVRAGYAAAEAVTAAAGEPRRFVVPDLAPRGLMRLFARSSSE